MRELTTQEINFVAGGYFNLHNKKIPSPPLAVRAAYYGFRAVPVVRAGLIGYSIGNAINKYTPVQRWLATGIDRATGR